MTPVVARTVQRRDGGAKTDCMEPERTRNSPTKPLSMGRPMTESVVMTKRVTIQGSFAARPPYSRMS